MAGLIYLWNQSGATSGGRKQRKQEVPARLPTLACPTPKKKGNPALRIAMLVYGSGLR
jgi:hypothetical protein